MQELSIDYSQCRSAGNSSQTFVKIPSKYTSSSFKGSGTNCSQAQGANFQWKGQLVNRTFDGVEQPTFVCTLMFNIPNDLHPPVYLYYRLTNFYQNHRRYVKSLDSDQLKGTAVKNSSLGACAPLDTDKHRNGTGNAYYPCGLIANSVFNDTFMSPVQLNGRDSTNGTQYMMKDTGIAWSSDSALYNPTKYDINKISPPPNWALRYPNGYTNSNPPPNLKEREDVQVWMRTAGLPNFSKLARRNDNETMACSTYRVDIDDSTYSGLCRDILLMIPRFPRHSVRRHKITGYIDSYCDGREEPFPRDCLCRHWRHLHCAWHDIHSNTSDQAKASHSAPYCLTWRN